ncbi:hypothetical protein SLA2020_188730 [Shorea laevis]
MNNNTLVFLQFRIRTKRSRKECGDSTGQNVKRRIELPEDLFCPIMKRLPLIDIIRAKVVSHACNSSAASIALHEIPMAHPSSKTAQRRWLHQHGQRSHHESRRKQGLRSEEDNIGSGF